MCPTIFYNMITNGIRSRIDGNTPETRLRRCCRPCPRAQRRAILKKVISGQPRSISASTSNQRTVRRSDPPCFGREELFYQLGLRQFGNFPKLKLDPPAPLRPLITLAVDAEQNTELSNLSKPQIVDVSDFLIMRLFRSPRFILTGRFPFFIHSLLRISLSLGERC